jgi:hypothetical protein
MQGRGPRRDVAHKCRGHPLVDSAWGRTVDWDAPQPAPFDAAFGRVHDPRKQDDPRMHSDPNCYANNDIPDPAFPFVLNEFRELIDNVTLFRRRPHLLASSYLLINSPRNRQFMWDHLAMGLAKPRAFCATHAQEQLALTILSYHWGLQIINANPYLQCTNTSFVASIRAKGAEQFLDSIVSGAYELVSLAHYDNLAREDVSNWTSHHRPLLVVQKRRDGQIAKPKGPISDLATPHRHRVRGCGLKSPRVPPPCVDAKPNVGRGKLTILILN